MSAPRHRPGRVPSPANDNGRRKRLAVELDLPAFLPVQACEVEVLAELLESLQDLAANDNEASSE